MRLSSVQGSTPYGLTASPLKQPLRSTFKGTPSAIHSSAESKSPPQEKQQPTRAKAPQPGFWKKAFLTSLALIPLAPAATAQSQTPPGDLQSYLIDLPFRQHQQIVPFRFESTVLSPQEDARYQALRKSWQTAESVDIYDINRQAHVNYVQSQWNQLLSQAQMDQPSAKKILYKLFQDQLFDEINAPGPQLIRFDFAGHNERITQWKQGKITLAKLQTETRWRGLEGLANHLGSLSSDGLKDLTQRFYPLVKAMVDAETNDSIQKWGQSSLQYMFNGMTASQQQDTIARFQKMYLDTPASPTKLFAMKGLATMRMQSSFQPIWGKVIKQVENQLQTAQKDPAQQATVPYYLVFLGMVQAPDMAEHVTPLLSPQQPQDVQCAIAWSLGRVAQAKHVQLLEGIIENGQYTAQAREMAFYSLENIRQADPGRADRLLNDYAIDRPTIDDNVEESARAMLEKLDDRSTTEAEFYIKRLMSNDKERQEYRDLRGQYIRGFENLNLAQKNFIDRALIPYKQYLPTIIRKQGKHEIIKGSVTESPSYKYLTGHRIQDGRMWDDVSGVSSTGGAVTSAQALYPGRFNTFAHEFMHHLHQMVLNNQPGKTKEIEGLFQQGKALDYYAAGDEYEYLGQGGEAHNARYKDHAILYASIFNKGYESTDSHIRSQLKRQDPALYEFIERVLTEARRLSQPENSGSSITPFFIQQPPVKQKAS